MIVLWWWYCRHTVYYIVVLCQLESLAILGGIIVAKFKGHELPTANYQLPTANYQLPTANYQLPTANVLSSMNCELSSMNYQLRVALRATVELGSVESSPAQLTAQFTGPSSVQLRPARFNCAQLDWAGPCELSWAQLNRAERSWIELSSVESSWAQLNWAELSWIELSSVESSWAQLNHPQPRTY